MLLGNSPILDIRNSNLHARFGRSTCFPSVYLTPDLGLPWSQYVFSFINYCFQSVFNSWSNLSKHSSSLLPKLIRQKLPALTFKHHPYFMLALLQKEALLLAPVLSFPSWQQEYFCSHWQKQGSSLAENILLLLTEESEHPVVLAPPKDNDPWP